MKTLIIDDESHVRETIRLLIPWEEYGIDEVMEASGGEEAMQIITADKPQIVFTDIKMPGINGIDLLQWISKHAAHTKVIVVSGYDDYQFMRSVLQYGGFDYILKPIDQDELKEIFGKAVGSWCSEEDLRSRTKEVHKKANQLKPVLADKLLSQLIIDPQDYTNAAKMLQEDYALSSEINECRIAVINWDIIDVRLRSKFINAMDLLRFAVTNICNEFMQREQMGVAFQNWHHHDTVLLFFNRLHDVPDVLDSIQKGLYTALRGYFYMGIGLVHSFPIEINRTYEEAQIALKRRNLLIRTEYIHVYEDNRIMAFSHSFSVYEDRLFLAMQKESQASIREALTEWVSGAEKLGAINMNHLEMWWNEFVVMHSKWMKQTESDPDQSRLDNKGDLTFELPLSEWQEVKLSMWIPKMERILVETAQRLGRSKPNNLIHEIEQYMRVHYCEELKLNILAEQFHLSASHLSRTFKQQFGENVTDYIVRLRIGKAKRLLTDPEIKISTVASAVGYQDEKYFSKAFKQYEGVSPREFRASYKK